MAIKKNTVCSVNMDSFFPDVIVDPNGVAVTDINAGLDTLFKMFNEEAPKYTESQNYLVKDFEEAYPELVAKNSIMANEAYWWWLLLVNRIENPFVEIAKFWVLSILNTNDINSLIETGNTIVENKNTQRIGNIIELN